MKNEVNRALVAKKKLTILFALLTLSAGLAQAEIVYRSKSEPTCEQRGFTQNCWEDTESGKIYANEQCTQDLNPAEVIRYAKFATSPISYLDTYAEKENATYAEVPFYWAAERGFGSTVGEIEAYAMEFIVRDDNPTHARIKLYKSTTNNSSCTENFHFFVYVNTTEVSDIQKGNESALFSVPLNGLKKGDIIEIKVQRGAYELFGSTSVAAALEYCSPNCGAISDITVTPTAPSWRKAQGTADPEFSYKVDGNIFPNIPLQGITVTRAEGETPGTYTITASCPEGANPHYNISFKTATFTIANTAYHAISPAPDCQSLGWAKNCWKDLEAHKYYTDALLTQEISWDDVIQYPTLIAPCWTATKGNWDSSRRLPLNFDSNHPSEGEGKFTIYGRNIFNARLKVSYTLSNVNSSIITGQFKYTYKGETYSNKLTIISNVPITIYLPLENLQYGDVIEIAVKFSVIKNISTMFLGAASVDLEYLSDNCGDSTKLNLTAEDLVVSNYNGHTYDGTPQAATVTFKEGITGAGDITVTYKQEGETVTPINAGDYDIYVSVTEGNSYHALEETQLLDGNTPYRLQIVKADPTEDMFVYSAPTNLVYDGQSKYAKVTFDDQNGKLSGMGVVTLEYKLTGSGQTEETGWSSFAQDPGTYQVYVDNIGEGTNYHLSNDDFTKDGWQFTITQGTLTAEDFELDNIFATYDGQVHTATVKLKQGITGAGTITAITYQQGTTDVESPTAVGEYDIYVSVAEGTGYAAVDKMKVGKLTISLSNYFYIENRGTGSKKIGMRLYGEMSENEIPHIAYSKDGVNWTEVTYSTDYIGNIDVYYATGNKVYFRACDANDPSLPATNTTFSLSDSKYVKVLSNSTYLSVGGNIMSLLKGADFESMTAVPSYAFYNLFYDLSYLQDASALLLPATELAEYCYASMFSGCTGLSAAPELPATTLVSHCYDQMFYNCAVLTSLRVAFTEWNSGAYTKYWLGSKNDYLAGRLVTSPNPKFYCPLQLNTSTSPFTRNGNYVPANWDIVKPTLSVSDFVISDNEFTYDGEAKAAAVDIKEGIEGAGEMTVTYKQGDEEVTPINAGVYAIFVSVAQSEKYTAFPETQVGTLTIAKATLTAADLVISDNSFTYDGEAKKVEVSMVSQSMPLPSSDNITIYYNNDKTLKQPVNAGSYQVYIDIRETNNYNAVTGLTSEDWKLTIAKATPTANLFTASQPETSVYDGNEKTATVTFNDQDGNLTGIGNVTIKYNGNEQTPINAGDYTVSIDVAEGDNFTAATGLTNNAWTFTITKAVMTADDFEFTAPENLVYDGNEKTATVTFNDQDGKLTGVGDINVWHKNVTTGELNFGPVINIGTYQVYLSIAEGDNYYARMSGNKITDGDWQFTIIAPDPPIDEWATVRENVTPNNWNTICMENNITDIDGATFWNVVAEKTDVFELEQVFEPQAGYGYIIRYTANTLKVKFGDQVADDPVDAEANELPIQGRFDAIECEDDGTNELVGNYVVYNNELRKVTGWVTMADHRAYVIAGKAPSKAPAPNGAPRMTMPKPNSTPTEFGTLPYEGKERKGSFKVIENGQFRIIRDNKMYNAQGIEVR